jgi:hypothetical protein
MSRNLPTICAISFGLMLNATSFSNAAAQEKCKVSEELEAASSTYTQQHAVDVGDVPGH